MSEPVVVTAAQVRGLRAARQHLAGRVAQDRLLDVVRVVCGLHAQVFSSAVLQAAARVEEVDAAVVRELLWERRTLVKTWAMRGTLHLLPAAELGLWSAAQRVLPPRWASPSWLKANGLTASQARGLYEALPRVLDGAPLSREALAAAIGDAVGHDAALEAAMHSWGSVLKPAAMRGGMVFADDDERRVRFTRPDRWLAGVACAPDGTPVGPEPDAAILEVTRRWLSAYGPGTGEDLARWFGTPSAASAGRWIAALGDEVTDVLVEGEARPRKALAGDVAALEAAVAPREPRLLGAFDHHVVALLRDPVALAQDRRPEVSRKAGWITPVLLLSGAMAGVWRHERRGRTLDVEVRPFRRLPRGAKAGIAEEAERLARVLGGDLRLRVG